MKKREIDAFGVLIGLIIGALFGYFIGARINNEKLEPVINENPVGSIYLLQITQGNDLDDINQTLKGATFNYEIVEEKGTFYVYTSIASSDDVLTAKKSEFVSYGFNPIIKSAYILDWPNKFSSDREKYDFYVMVIDNFINSINNKPIVIPEKYLSDPIDIDLFGNISLLRDIKNNHIKASIQLDTYKLLLEKCN